MDIVTLDQGELSLMMPALELLSPHDGQDVSADRLGTSAHEIPYDPTRLFAARARWRLQEDAPGA